MADDDALAAIAGELGLALQPLAEATSSADAMQAFLLQLGWDIAPGVALVEAVHASAATVYELVAGGDEGETPDLTALLSGLRAAYVAVADIASGGGGFPADAVTELPRQLADYMVAHYLLLNQPRWGHLLRAVGVLRIENVDETATRPAYTRLSIDYEGFADLVDDPLTFFRTAYQWGTSAFRGEEFADALRGLAVAWELDAQRTQVDPLTLAQLIQGALTPATTVDTVLRMPFVSSQSEESYEVGVGLFLLPETAAAKPGFAVMPYGSAGIDLEIGLSELLTLVIGGTVKLDGGVGALVRPDKDLEFLVGFGPGTPSAASGTLSISLVVGAGEPMVLLGDPEASRFELDGASALGGVRFHSSGKFEVYVEAAVEGARIVIQPGDDSDSFLATLLPPEGLTIGTDLTVGFSTTQGLYFGGSGGLEIALPAHIQLGPLEIMSATIAVKFRDGRHPDRARRHDQGRPRCSRRSSRTSASPPRSPSRDDRAATSARPTSRSASSRRTASASPSTPASSRAAATSTSTSTAGSTPARSS